MTSRPLAVQVPATSANLGAGFDTFGIALDLHLTVAVDPGRTSGPRVRHTGEGADDLDGSDTNLVWASAQTRAERLGCELPDVRLASHNDIPLARGLGSSSAAIVAGLLLADELLGVEAPLHELAALADEVEGHPDNVVPALYGGLTTTARTDDDRLVVRRHEPHARLCAVMFVPDVQLLTSQARAVVPDELATGRVSEQVARAGHVLGALMGGWPLDADVVGDRLHEPPRFEHMPGTGALVAELRAAGVAAWLSGAGPAVAAALPVRDAQLHDHVRTLADAHGFVAEATPWDRSGGRTCPADGCGISGIRDCAACPRRRLA